MSQKRVCLAEACGEPLYWNATEYGTITAVYSVKHRMNHVHADLNELL
jgi:hypothetical protein